MLSNHDFKSAPCILCGSIGLTFVNNTRDTDKHQAAKCNVCDHVQLTPLPTIAEDERYYQNNQGMRNLVQKSELDDTQLMNKYEPWAVSQVDTVRHILPKGKSLLEIGSGYGWFIEKIRAEGYMAEGIEISDEKCNMALDRANIQLHNINILCGISQDIRKFDAICMFHLLEHIPNPVEFLRRASEFLNDKGMVVIEVPNFNAYMKKYSNEYNDFQYFRAHLSYFTPDTLKKAMNMAGFGEVRILGKQLYSVENAIHWMRNKVPFKPYSQLEMPEGLEFVNNFFKEEMEKNMTSDMLVATGVLL